MLGLYHDIINVDFDIPSDLLSKIGLHTSLIGCSGVFQPESHDVVTENTVRGDERGQHFVLLLELDLVIPGVCFEKTETITSCCRVDYLVNTRQREMILRAILIETCIIDTHAKSCCVFLWHHECVGHPLGLLELPNESGLAEPTNLFTDRLSRL
jgi:hypothetical protein